MKLSKFWVNLLSWSVVVASAATSVLVWGQLGRWQFVGLDAYDLFPLFGLLAYGGMWSQYVAGAIRRAVGYDRAVLNRFINLTSVGVLFFLLLHPGLLAWRLASSGQGFPPQSYFYYVGESLRFSIFIGVVAWLAFMLYELRRFLEHRVLRSIINFVSNAAMILIFFHGLRLGSHMNVVWFRWAWYFYGASYLTALIYNYTRDKKEAASA